MSNTPKLLNPAPIDVKAMIASARLPERTVPLCLRGDLTAEFEDLMRALVAAASVPDAPGASDSLAGPEPDERIEELKTRVDALKAEMEAGTYVFRVRATARPAFNKLIVEHPPRDGVVGDQNAGYDVHAVETILVRTGVFDPAMTAAEWDEMDLLLTPWQYTQLVSAADAATLEPVESVPFSFAELARSPVSAPS